MIGALLVVPVHAATIITFDAHPPDFSTPIFDSGFQFDFNASGWGVFGPGSGACCNVNYNGTPALFADGDRSDVATAVMTMVGGGAFDVSSLDASVYWIGASGQLNLIGQLEGGGTVTTTLDVTSTWASFSLSNFNNLVSLTFQDSQHGGFLVAPGFGIDNINTAASTPEPATLALLASGMLGLAGMRRKLTR